MQRWRLFTNTKFVEIITLYDAVMSEETVDSNLLYNIWPLDNPIFGIANKEGDTVLHTACRKRDMTLLQWLLRANLSCINLKNNAGKTAFMTMIVYRISRVSWFVGESQNVDCNI